jgi:hypothetical protein
MVASYTPLIPPPLIDNTDLLPYVYSRIQAASTEGGVPINDFGPSSPVAALAEGLIFPCQELRYHMNKFASTMAIAHLKIAGVQRRIGAQAEVYLRFTLSSPLSNPFYLSAGYMVSTADGIEFLTSENLLIAPGSSSGDVRATARVFGIKGNVPPYSITQLSETRAFLQGVTNPDRASGGLDEETDEEVLSRGFAALRYRGVLTTADDFEGEALRILGAGAVAKAIGRLAADRITREKGATHLFVLNPDGTIPTQAQLDALKSAMQSAIPTFLQESKTTTLGTGFYVSAIELVPVEVYVVARLSAGDDPERRARAIYADLKSKLTPGELPLGSTIQLKEIEYVVRQAGVESVTAASFHLPNPIDPAEYEVSYADIQLPNEYSAAQLRGAIIDLVDQENNPFTFPFGITGDVL